MCHRKMTVSIALFFFIFVFSPGQAEQDPVPGVVTSSGRFDRVVVIRMKHGTDLLGGLKRAVESEKILNGVFLAGIGSLTSWSLHVVDNSTFPTQNVFFRDSIPVDLVTVSGYVFNGRVHAHIGISDEHKALGGHLEPGCRVFTFAIVTLGVFDDKVVLDRFDDKDWR